MKVSTVGKLILSVKFYGKCDSCGKMFEFTLNDDVYIYLPTGRVRVKCPHCGQEHDTSLKIEKAEVYLDGKTPVPSYDEVKEMSQKIERLEFDNEALEMAYNEVKEINDKLVSKTDELVQKIHILNEQNTKQYNELCEEIKKNNILEKRLEIATKALKDCYNDMKYWAVLTHRNQRILGVIKKSLKEMEGVK